MSAWLSQALETADQGRQTTASESAYLRLRAPGQDRAASPWAVIRDAPTESPELTSASPVHLATNLTQSAQSENSDQNTGFDFLSSLKLALSLLMCRTTVPAPPGARRLWTWAVKGMCLLERI